jgi:NTP pyrophosphatase (non-canonical NTP hydrolase)
MYKMFSQTLDSMADAVHETAVEKGFWTIMDDATQEQKDIFITKQLMMIVSEAVEVMEAIRKSRGPEDVADEMADIIIRTLDLYAGMRDHEYVNKELQVAFNKKTSYNITRPERNGVKF